MTDNKETKQAPAVEAGAREGEAWRVWGDVIEALERAFIALGRSGNNAANGPYRDEWLKARDAITAAQEIGGKAVVQALARASDHEFKNFHRLLCKRFDYAHDEKDWKRDQLSLIEWIATRASEAAAGEPVAWVRKHPDTGELSGDWLWNDAIEKCRKDSGVWFPLGFLAAPQPASEQQCVGCEGKPAPGNNPCGVCGASEQQDHFDTLLAVLNAIGYTEEFAAAHPDLKVSEGVKLFLALQNGAVECGAHIGPDCTECGGTGVWTGEHQAARGLSDVTAMALYE